MRYSNATHRFAHLARRALPRTIHSYYAILSAVYSPQLLNCLASNVALTSADLVYCHYYNSICEPQEGHNRDQKISDRYTRIQPLTRSRKPILVYMCMRCFSLIYIVVDGARRLFASLAHFTASFNTPTWRPRRYIDCNKITTLSWALFMMNLWRTRPRAECERCRARTVFSWRGAFQTKTQLQLPGLSGIGDEAQINRSGLDFSIRCEC